MGAHGLCRCIGYDFRQPELLRRALTHRSYGSPNNERLEFLGDNVLDCVVALELFRLFPQLSEGGLSRLWANLVNKQALCEVAQNLGIGEHLLLGEGELKSGGVNRPSILADAVESLFGAVFLDGGFDAAQRVINTVYAPLIQRINPDVLNKDPKTLLQEFLQGRRYNLPQYNVIAARGHAHQQEFQVECVIAELKIRSVGQGSSKRGAEQDAAAQAYRLATGA